MVTLTIEVLDRDGGLVSTPDGGISCPARCTEQVPAGAVRSLQARPLGRFVFSGWDGGSCSGKGSCSVTLTTNTTIQAGFAEPNVAFVTSSTFQGNFGGLDGGMQICAAVAADAGLSGTFVPFLGVTGSRADERLAGSRGWVNVDGTPFADTVEELMEGRVMYGLKTERGAFTETVTIWTGTARDGGVARTCNDWTTNSSSLGVGGSIGRPHAGGKLWMSTERADLNAGVCAAPYAVACFGVGRVVPVEPTPIPDGGRVVFVSSGLINGAVDEAAADALCTQEGGRTFLAARPRPDGGSFDARVTRRDRTWYRPDGVLAYRFGTSPTSFLYPSQALNGLADAGYVVDSEVEQTCVWTGPQFNVDVNTTCTFWTSTAGNGWVGVATGPTRFASGQQACTSTCRVYCFEP